MEIKTINPKDCTGWKHADRAEFEMGNIYLLAQDIKQNGQIEPVIARPSKDKHFKYEIVTGSRRLKACEQAGLALKAIVQDMDDQQAMVAQIKENQKQGICDYSKGICFSSLIEEKTATRKEIIQTTGISRMQFERFLYFEKIPQQIWDAVQIMSKVSARAAETIYTISKKHLC